MDENSAWKTFCQTGHIQDYMQYLSMKNADKQGLQGTAYSPPVLEKIKEQDAAKNRGTDY